jgi:hypothetical protein
MRRREFIGLRLSESESNLTLSEKRFCRQGGDMWCFDSASPWTCLISGVQSGHSACVAEQSHNAGPEPFQSARFNRYDTAS